MVGIVFATRREADPFLAQTPPNMLAQRPFDIFRMAGNRGASCLVVVSGMGKVAAAAAAAHLVLAHGVSLLVSAGLCGCLAPDERWATGDLVRVSTAVEGDRGRFGGETAAGCAAGWFGRLASARLVTCDRPVFDSARRERLAGMGDIADMEGAAVARVADLYRIPCAMVKGISDHADRTGPKTLARNIDRVSERIAQILVDELLHRPAEQTP